MGRKRTSDSRVRPEAPEGPKKAKRNPRRPPLTRDQQELARRYLPLARALAKPLRAAWPVEGDEFESAACLALVEAAQTYDPSRNVKFATFARYRIWGALRDVQRGLIMAGWRGDLENAPVITSLTSSIEEHGLILGSEPDRPVEETVDALDTVESWLRKLPKQHAAACRQIYLHDQTQAEAAAALGCSKSRLSYLHKESLEMLNDAFRWKNATEDADSEAEADVAAESEPAKH
jgi:RNA polymerase sigma factor for flagellar operon FliA